MKPTQAKGVVRDVYALSRRHFGTAAPPYLAHSPDEALVAAAWAVEHETVLAPGVVPRATKEAVAAAVSRSNGCRFCADAHGMMLHAAADADTAEAVAEGRPADVADDGLRRVVEWAVALRDPDAPALRAPPFTAEEAPEILGAALGFHYLNRMVDVLVGPDVLPFRPPQALDQTLKRLGGAVMRPLVRREAAPGAGAALVETADVPPEFAWALPNPNVARAWAALSAACEAGGERGLTPSAKERVLAHLAKWRGDDPGLSRAWVDEAARGLEGEDAAGARLALLAALAPHQVDERAVYAYRRYRPSDRELVGALAWASLEATRRIGSWVRLPEG